jgi:DNA-directed RNA polymerase alpha subunit
MALYRAPYGEQPRETHNLPIEVVTMGPFGNQAKARDWFAREDAREEKFSRFCAARQLDPTANKSTVLFGILVLVPISALGLSNRCCEAFQRLKVESLADLLCYTRDDLLVRTISFGPTPLNEVENRLREIREVLGLRE